MEYRTKPVIIEAWQVGSQPVPHFIDVALANNNLHFTIDRKRWFMPNEHDAYDDEGANEAKVGDWIIRNLDGELYLCRDSIFKLKYEPIDKG